MTIKDKYNELIKEATKLSESLKGERKAEVLESVARLTDPRDRLSSFIAALEYAERK
jgi:hypothetical protein